MLKSGGFDSFYEFTLSACPFSKPLGTVPCAITTICSLSFIFNFTYYYLHLYNFFHTSFSWWFLTGIWVTSLLKSPGLFSIFWPISTMLLSGWSQVVLLFQSPLVLIPILWWLCQDHQLQLVSQSLSCSRVFSDSLVRSRYLSFFLLSFNFTLWSARTAKSTIRQVFFPWFFGKEYVIRLCLTIPENFMYLIFQNRFWVVDIPFVRMIKFKFVALILVEHLSYTVVSSLIPFLCKISAFAYNVIDQFVSIVIIGSYGVVLNCFLKKSFFPFNVFHNSIRWWSFTGL